MKKLFLICILALQVPPVLAGDEGVTATEIKLGASVVLSGPLGAQTREFGAGSRLYFDAVNEQGGVYGRKISYLTIDDAFDVPRSVENTKKLIAEEKVFLIYNNSGTGHTAAILPLLEASRTIVFGPITGASMFRDKFNRYLFHVRASYANEARRIVSQLKQIGITKVVAFYQDDTFGKTLLSEIRKAATQESLQLAGEVKVDPKQPDFKAAALETEKWQPQAVIMGTGGATFPAFVKAVRQTSARPIYYGFSTSSLDVINKELGSEARGIVLAQIMPSLKSESVPVVTEYMALLRKKSPGAQPSTFRFEGFVHAKLLVEGLQRGGRNLTTESFIKGMEAAGEINYGRFTARYTPEAHNGSSYVELAIIDAEGQLRY
ncbi:ABC transporter substrate-binding protein [Polaromonas sp.]|uniref:ABC transporter substrate-binding protein n=1 Tax=Polaromonas sp. TaxID=1869339 RepID=UPI003265E1CC